MSAAVLTLVGDPELAGHVDRVAAAAGAGVLRLTDPARRVWLAAAAVLLDESAARQCAARGLPRREGVLLLVTGEPSTSVWSAAVQVGAQHVYCLPGQEAELVSTLSGAAEKGTRSALPGRVIVTVPGRGGGGASVFATAVALCAGDALLLDLDPCGGGLDLLLGVESRPGPRWRDLRTQAGRLSWTAVRDALPGRDGVSVLSATRAYHDIDAALFASIADAGRRGGTTVVCDVPRQFGPAAVHALELADLVAVVTCCEVRGIAAASAVTGMVRGLNRNVGLVVRGPAPGGLSVHDAVEVVGAPLVAAMRPEPMLARRLEQGGLCLRRRSPLTAAARTVLASASAAPETAA